MDLRGPIEALKEQKQRVERAIAELESLHGGRTRTQAEILYKRRGRKSMDVEERQDVSKRMKQYWAKRRETRGQQTPSSTR